MAYLGYKVADFLGFCAPPDAMPTTISPNAFTVSNTAINFTIVVGAVIGGS